jgi:cell division protein ZipA
MDGMRWLLLLIGLLVIGCVYLYSRRAPRPAKKPVIQLRREPTLDAGPTTDADSESGEMPFADDVAVSDETTSAAGADVSAALARQTPQKIVALRIIARGGGAFRGDELILSLRGVGMRHGKFGIFHRFDDPNEEQAIFSAASLIEPGSFDLANVRDQEIPGISLFSVLPGPLPGVEAFDIMMAAARKLAQELNGELLDESGSTLSIQRERYMREEVVQFQHRHKVA